ncbi:putative gata type zinc finger protein asd4 [Fusarium flagelliforme]|uniref:Putative gata type zinc finger protein asd4 n=1 Tax=Fusarium flagelliforme TaxID=2675880 RepID=A0A395MTL5_9HYPO|nr:putative gata type zinc finger protein asd4 [Fusarium flagelliforme]
MEEDGTQILAQAALDPISRPESTSTSASNLPHGLPGISALAAANAATDATAQLRVQRSETLNKSSIIPSNNTNQVFSCAPQLTLVCRASVAASPAMYPTASPAATSGGSGSTMPTCHNCSTSTTPLWRRDEFGAVLCNACGLFLKLHGRARPISLKTDVIKSRNRVKTMRPDLANKKKVSSMLSDLALLVNIGQQQQQAQQQAAQGFGTTDANGFDTTGQAAAAAAHAARQASHNKANGHDGESPMSRNGTPSMYAHGLSSFMVDDPYQSGFVATGEGRATSPMNGDRKNDGPLTQEQLIAQNSSLKTRVSELEVIIELFRGRLAQLEQQEASTSVELNQTRSELDTTRDSEAQLRAQLEDSHRRENSLKRRLDDLELELQAVHSVGSGSDERPAKRPRTTDEPYKTQSETDIEAAAEALLASDVSRSHEVTENAPTQSSEAAQSLEETKQAHPAPETDDVPIDPDMPMMDDAHQSEVKVQAHEDAGVDAPAPTDGSSEAADDTEAAASENAAT